MDLVDYKFQVKMAASNNLQCIIFVLIFTANAVVGHIPLENNYNTFLAEPDTLEYVPMDQSARILNDNSLERLKAVRKVMEEHDVDAYIVPTSDAHNSQYIAPADARRTWLSGLRGSSGTVVVTSSKALVWTDSRYFTQFYIQVNTTYFDLMRQGIDASVNSWLVDTMLPNSVVGVDPTTYTGASWSTLEVQLQQINVSLKATPKNLVDIARTNIGDPPPPRPSNDLIPLSVNFTGKPAFEKINEIMSSMTARGASALVLTALDEIAHVLNIRGSDIPYNPVFFSYLIIKIDKDSSNQLILFWGDGELPPAIAEHLSSERTNITTLPYDRIFNYLEEMAVSLPIGSQIWLSPDASQAIYSAVENSGDAKALSAFTPVPLMKTIKNEVELKGFRSALTKDSVALVRLFRWLEEQVAAGEEISEMDLSDKAADFRKKEEGFQGPSFSTIAGAGENGAIIHYSPSIEGPQRIIRKDDMVLLDSGGQYKDGTTDITRTRHMSASPTDEQRLTFTRVLKGQISLGTALFPHGIAGYRLETFARKALWDVGLNYGHGTGHGVGHFLNVHEGPSGILSSPINGDPGILPGMIFSNEPGYYEVGHYGIRHEDLVEVIEVNRNADHIRAKDLVGNFTGDGVLGFYYLSLVPQQIACIDVNLLSEFEIEFINDYHTRVLNTLGPILQGRNLTDDYEWLKRECARIPNAAILPKTTPFLFVSVVIARFLLL